MNKKRALLTSILAIILCIVTLAATTWALFTEERYINNHVQAGDLTITLKRTELTKTMLDELGYLVSFPVQSATDEPKDFTKNPDENVFEIAPADINGNGGEKIVPGCMYVATMQIENHSDVAFRYWIEIKCDSDDQEDGANLAKQLKVTVTTTELDENGDPVAYNDFVGNGLVVRGPKGYVGELAIGATGTFIVTVEFLDSDIESNGIEDNNLAKREKLDFDLVVHAVQATAPASQE